MSFSINTNIASLQAQNYLLASNNFQKQTIGEVSSGLRIVNSGDDPTGLAMANGLETDQVVLSQGVQNSSSGETTLQTIDGGMSNINTLLNRAQTLATESASGTFTGDRTTLNNEFQSVLTEIDRQAQSVGMNQQGQYAQDLSVLVGDGVGGAAAQNGSINLDLSKSSVDASSLGLQGVQAEGNPTADLSDASATNVASILANSSNQLSESVPGSTTFTFKGPGFSDANAVSVSVNLSAVTDLATLVDQINSSLLKASGAAFLNAGIKAIVVTDNTGAEHLAFTSGTAAFSVGPGDQTANALLGTLSSGTTGAPLTAIFAGGTPLGNFATTTATQNTTIKLQIQGGGMTTPDNSISLTVNQGDTLQSVMNQLETQVAADPALIQAGISLNTTASVAAGHLTFQTTSGQQFSVIAGGDVDNLLGLGTNQLSNSGAIQYSSTTGTPYDNASRTVSGTANFAFSFNGASSNSNSLAVDLQAGDATAGQVTGTSNATVDTSTGNQLTLKIDGANHVIDLTTGADNGSSENLSQVANDINNALAGTPAAGFASVTSGQLVISSGTLGTASSLQVVNTGLPNDAAAALGLNTTIQYGTNRTGGNIAAYLTQQIALTPALKAAGLSASFASQALTISSSNGTLFQLNAFGSADVGFGSKGVSFTGNIQGTLADASNVLSGGSYQADGYSFSPLANGADTQEIGITVVDSTGADHSATIGLQNNSSSQNGANIDAALTAINTQLQASNDSMLQSITAVKYNFPASIVNGNPVPASEKIAFLNAAQPFSVAVSGPADGSGLSGAGTTVTAVVTGTGYTTDILTAADAGAAVTALSTAVQSLGSSQAVVGRGENLLNYANSLAQSRGTNDAATQSSIRDANLAQEAANLTKAQILMQAGVAALAQANSDPQALLKLLQG